MSRAEQFEECLFASEAIDPQGVHHEFNQGLHGRKADFDKIDDASALFEEWVDLTVDHIQERYETQPDAVVGVAKGTNRLAKPVAERLGSEVLFLETKKEERSKPVLTEGARLLVEEFEPVFALVVDDVGTRGTNTLSAARSTLEAGVERVKVLYALQRSVTLELLDEAGMEYDAIIHRYLPSYTPEECRAEGLCADGWRLIPYGG